MNFLTKKLRAEPVQQELAILLIAVLEGRTSVSNIMDYMERQRWSKIDQGDRLRHALSLVKTDRGELYRGARQICSLIYRSL